MKLKVDILLLFIYSTKLPAISLRQILKRSPNDLNKYKEMNYLFIVSDTHTFNEVYKLFNDHLEIQNKSGGKHPSVRISFHVFVRCQVWYFSASEEK